MNYHNINLKSLFIIFLVYTSLETYSKEVLCKPLPKGFPHVIETNSKIVDKKKLRENNFLYEGKIVTNKPNFDLSRDDAKGIKCTLDYNFIVCPVSQNFPKKKFKRLSDFFLILKPKIDNKVLLKLKGSITPVSEKTLKKVDPFNFPEEIHHYLDLTKSNSESKFFQSLFNKPLLPGFLDINLLKGQLFIFNGFSPLSGGSAKHFKTEYCILDIKLEDIPFYKGNLFLPTSKQGSSKTKDDQSSHN